MDRLTLSAEELHELTGYRQPAAQPHPLDHESRALWHLELLGCFAPEDAVAPWEPVPVQWSDYDDDEGGYLGDMIVCWHCGGEGMEITCCDDICHGIGYCMHGDGQRFCPTCHGEGIL